MCDNCATHNQMGIIEQVHKVFNDCLHTFELQKQELNENDPWSLCLSVVALAYMQQCITPL